jgi:hypothetical protein
VRDGEDAAAAERERPDRAVEELRPARRGDAVRFPCERVAQADRRGRAREEDHDGDHLDDPDRSRLPEPVRSR